MRNRPTPSTKPPAKSPRAGANLAFPSVLLLLLVFLVTVFLRFLFFYDHQRVAGNRVGGDGGCAPSGNIFRGCVGNLNAGKQFPVFVGQKVKLRVQRKVLKLDRLLRGLGW